MDGWHATKNSNGGQSRASLRLAACCLLQVLVPSSHIIVSERKVCAVVSIPTVTEAMSSLPLHLELRVIAKGKEYLSER